MAVTRVYVPKGCLCCFLLLQEALQVGPTQALFRLLLTAQSVAYNAPVLPYKRSVDFQKLGCVLISFICFYFSAGSLLSHGLSLVVASGDYSRYSAWA